MWCEYGPFSQDWAHVLNNLVHLDKNCMFSPQVNCIEDAQATLFDTVYTKWAKTRPLFRLWRLTSWVVLGPEGCICSVHAVHSLEFGPIWSTG